MAKPRKSSKNISSDPSANEIKRASESVDNVFDEERKKKILRFLDINDEKMSDEYIYLCVEGVRLFHLNQIGAKFGRVSAHRKSLRDLSGALDNFTNAWDDVDKHLKKKIDLFLKERQRHEEINKKCLEMGGFDPEPQKSWWDRLSKVQRHDLDECLNRDFEASILAFMPSDEVFDADRIVNEIFLLHDAVNVMTHMISPKRGRPQKRPATNAVGWLVEIWKSRRKERITVGVEDHKIEGELIEFVRYVLGPFMVVGSPFESKLDSAVQQALYGKGRGKSDRDNQDSDGPDSSDSD